MAQYEPSEAAWLTQLKCGYNPPDIMLNRIVVVLIALLAVSTSALSQSEASKSQPSPPELTDLAGEWELDLKESDYRVKPPYTGGSLTVRVIGQEVLIKRQLEDSQGSREREFSYYGDGRGEINILVAMDGSRTFERPSRSNWKKGKLVIKISEKSNFGWIDTEEAYALSSDGKKLTYTNIPRMATTAMFRPTGSLGKLVFRRKS